MPGRRLPGIADPSARPHAGVDGGTSPRYAAAPPRLGTDDGVLRMSTREKLVEAFRRTPRYLTGATRDEFLALISPRSLEIIAGSMLVFAGLQFFGVGEVIDLGALALGAGAVMLGYQSGEAAGELVDFARIAATAKTGDDLDRAAMTMAHAVIHLGVATISAILLHRAAAAGEATAVPETPWAMTPIAEDTAGVGRWLAEMGTPFKPPLVRARVEIALEFFRKNSAGKVPPMTVADVLGYFKGIDFSKEVRLVELPEDTPLAAFNRPGSVGRWFTRQGPGTDRLGIAQGSRAFGRYRTVGKTWALESRAAPVEDTWTVRGQKIDAGGGGLQYTLPPGAEVEPVPNPR